MNKLKFALLGCGRIGERHAEQIQRVGILEAVCDKVVSKASKVGQKYGSKIYTDFDELLRNENNLDVINFGLGQQISVEDCIRQIVVQFGFENFHYYDEFLLNHPYKPQPPA